MSTTYGGSPRNDRLSTEELRAWRGFFVTAAALRAQLEALMQEASGLSGGDYAVLLALIEAGDRALRPSELAEAISWERSRLSHHLGRMERRGLVRRDPCIVDSSGSELRITPAGRRAQRAAAGPHMRAIREYFAEALTPEQMHALVEITDALTTHLASLPADSSDAVAREERARIQS